jgi:hypothetical protein
MPLGRAATGWPESVLTLWRERSAHTLRKFWRASSRPYWLNDTRAASPSATSPISGTALSVPESASTLTWSRRGSLATLNRAVLDPMGGSAAKTKSFSSANKE